MQDNWNFHDGQSSHWNLLGPDTVWYCPWLPAFRRNRLPAYSGRQWVPPSPNSDSLCMHGHVHTHINNSSIISFMISCAVDYILVRRHVAKVKKLRYRNERRGRRYPGRAWEFQNVNERLFVNRWSLVSWKPASTDSFMSQWLQFASCPALFDSGAFPFMHRPLGFSVVPKLGIPVTHGLVCPCNVWAGLLRWTSFPNASGGREGGKEVTFIWIVCTLSACALDRFL